MSETNPEATLASFLDEAEEAPAKRANTIPIIIHLNQPNGFKPFVIDKRMITMGRSPSCDIPLDMGTISRRHANIYFDNMNSPSESPQCIIEDRNSRNGTFLNKKRIKGQQMLSHGDTILIGGAVLGFYIKSKEEMAQAPSFEIEMNDKEIRPSVQRLFVNLDATVRVLIPEESFTPRAIACTVKDINIKGLRLESTEVDSEAWSYLLKDKRYIQCTVQLPGGESLNLSGRMAWIDYDNKATPPQCTIGMEFHQMTKLQREELEGKLKALNEATRVRK